MRQHSNLRRGVKNPSRGRVAPARGLAYTGVMVDPAGKRARLDELVARGELAPWKAALLAEWLATAAAAERPSPSPEDIAALLLDDEVRARLARVPGPWEALAAQARGAAPKR
jgi:hypothetical protein